MFAEVAQGYLPMVGDESLEGSQLLVGEGSDELSDLFRCEQLFGQPGNPRRLWSLRIKLDVAQAGDKHEMALGALFEAFLESHGLSLSIGGMGPTYRTHPLIFLPNCDGLQLDNKGETWHTSYGFGVLISERGKRRNVGKA